MKLKHSMLAILFSVASLIFASHAAATSWVDLPPEEVAARADIVVQGRYDFESEAKDGAAIFVGYPFIVEKVYKGVASALLTAGIDGFDIGWASEFQTEGGHFLLFLEETEQAPFLIPVGGPNGMIQLNNGLIQPNMGEEAAYFQTYLDRTQSHNPDPSGESGLDQAYRPDDKRWLIVLLVLSGSAVLLFGYRIVQMRRHDSS